MRLFQAVISGCGMAYLDAAQLVTQSGVQGDITNDTGRCKCGGNTAETIVRSCQELILLDQIMPAYLDIVREVGGEENALPLTQSACRLVLDTVTTADDSIKELECIGILYHFIVFTDHAQHAVIIIADCGKKCRNIQFG